MQQQWTYSCSVCLQVGGYGMLQYQNVVTPICTPDWLGAASEPTAKNFSACAGSAARVLLLAAGNLSAYVPVDIGCKPQ
jgi:hypothetical protein